MTAILSIVVPTLNAESDLPRCLDSLIEGLTQGLIRDLVMTDGGSEDKTAEIADAVGATWITGPASRGGNCVAAWRRLRVNGCWCCMPTRYCRRAGPTP